MSVNEAEKLNSEEKARENRSETVDHTKIQRRCYKEKAADLESRHLFSMWQRWPHEDTCFLTVERTGLPSS